MFTFDLCPSWSSTARYMQWPSEEISRIWSCFWASIWAKINPSWCLAPCRFSTSASAILLSRSFSWAAFLSWADPVKASDLKQQKQPVASVTNDWICMSFVWSGKETLKNYNNISFFQVTMTTATRSVTLQQVRRFEREVNSPFASEPWLLVAVWLPLVLRLPSSGFPLRLSPLPPWKSERAKNERAFPGHHQSPVGSSGAHIPSMC